MLGDKLEPIKFDFGGEGESENLETIRKGL